MESDEYFFAKYGFFGAGLTNFAFSNNTQLTQKLRRGVAKRLPVCAEARIEPQLRF